MGRSYTPTYAVRLRILQGWGLGGPIGWNVKRDGRPTEENLARYVESFEASTRKGGVNAHLGEATVRTADIRRQATDEIVAFYRR